MMRFTPLLCPTCQAPARGTVERLAGVAEFAEPNEAGLVDYSGYTEVWWEELQTVTDPAGQARLICPTGHEWWAAMQEYADELVAVPAAAPARQASGGRRAAPRSGGGA